MEEIITAEMLQSMTWIKMLRNAAMDNATKEEKAAQYMATKKWEKWIHEGPASGLRRQHQFSRSATGWAATKHSSGEVKATQPYDELYDLDGLSAAELETRPRCQRDACHSTTRSR